MSESEIQEYVQKTILNDEILSGFVRRPLGTLKKTRANHHRPSNEKLWNNFWGETMSEIEDDFNVILVRCEFSTVAGYCRRLFGHADT